MSRVRTTNVCDLARELGTTPDFLYELGVPDEGSEQSDPAVDGPLDSFFHDVLSPEEEHRYRQAWFAWVKERAALSVARWVQLYDEAQGSDDEGLSLHRAARYGARLALSIEDLADLDPQTATAIVESHGAEHAEQLREILDDFV